MAVLGQTLGKYCFFLGFERQEVENYWAMRHFSNSHVPVGSTFGVCSRSSWSSLFGSTDFFLSSAW